MTEKEINTSKRFWKFIKPFLTNKGFIGRDNITLVKKKAVTTDEKTLAGTFNKHYINIVDMSSEKTPKIFQKYHLVKVNRKQHKIF